MIRWVLAIGAVCLAMSLPYLPGRYDASAAALSFAAQIAAYVSLLLVPLGIAWLAARGRAARLFGRLTLVVMGIAGVAAVLAAAAADALAFGIVLGVLAAVIMRWVQARLRTLAEQPAANARRLPVCLVAAPLVLVAFQLTAVPRAAAWSTARAIRHSAPLIAEIESYRSLRGRYPVSLQSLNADFPTGVIGVERFHYEPNGDAYNVYFVRQHVELDAKEVVLFNPRAEHRFASHALDLLRYDGPDLDLRRGDRRRTPLHDPRWISILFD